MNTYQIGDLTMEYVFRQNGLTNVSDWQLVMDAVEKALEYKNRVHRKTVAEMAAQAEAARYEDRA